MTVEQVPAFGVGLIMAAYWGRVAVMVVRVGRRTRRLQHMVVAVNPVERLMMLLWVPLIWAWISLPIQAAIPALAPFQFLQLPSLVLGNPAITFIRFVALGVAVIGLLLSVLCWMHMGNDWRMAIDPNHESRLIQDGPFGRVRHPIYALSIMLMICTVIILPTRPMMAIAVIHISLMYLKVHKEEQFLQQRYGVAFDEYRARTGRFLPRFSTGLQGSPTHVSANDGTAGGNGAIGAPPRIMKLNHFQRAMLLWEQLHAYNAVHAVRLRGPANPSALRESIEFVCRECGLGKLAIDGSRNRYAFVAAFDPAVLVELPPAKDPQHTLQQVVEEGLNTRFPEGPHHPIRWCVFDEAAGDAHRVVLVYHHVAADAAAIESLLGQVLHRYLGTSNAENTGPIVLGPPELVEQQARPFLRFGFFRSYFRTMSIAWRVVRGRRVRPEIPGDESIGMVSCRADAGLLAKMQDACRRHGIGLNDAFLAAVANTVASQTLPRPGRFSRDRIAMGTVISRRPRTEERGADYFGVCLSDLILSVDRPLDPFVDVAARISVQTRAYKNNPDEADATSDMRLFLARLARPYMSNTRASYRRSFPICAGVSTVSIKQSRFGDAANKIDEYIRACPPGPVMPVVLAPTILNDVLCLCVFHRRAFMNAGEAERFLAAVVDRLQEFAVLPARDRIEAVPHGRGLVPG